MKKTEKQEKELEQLQEKYKGSIPGIHVRDIFVAGMDSELQEQRPIDTKAPHPTEMKYPEQTKAFKETLDKMYQVHLDKNLDYSPANVQGMGMIGLSTRLWDKIVRLSSLVGFTIEAKFVSFTGSKEPKNESLEDTLMDLSVYGIIGRLMLLDKWGK